jgi:hypothetical protein
VPLKPASRAKASISPGVMNGVPAARAPFSAIWSPAAIGVIDKLGRQQARRVPVRIESPAAISPDCPSGF